MLKVDLNRLCRDVCMYNESAYSALTDRYCFCLAQKPPSSNLVDESLCRHDCVDSSGSVHPEGRQYCGNTNIFGGNKIVASVYIVSLGCRKPDRYVPVFYQNQWQDLKAFTNESATFFPYMSETYLYCPNNTVTPWNQRRWITVLCGLAGRWYFGPFECDREFSESELQ